MDTLIISFFAYLILLPFLMMLAHYSLRLYIISYKLNRTGLEMFLGKLRFPISNLFELMNKSLLGDDIDFIDIATKKDKSRPVNLTYSRHIWAIICLVYIGSVTIAFHKQSEILSYASHVLFLIVALSSTYVAWTFGSNAYIYKHYE